MIYCNQWLFHDTKSKVGTSKVYQEKYNNGRFITFDKSKFHGGFAGGFT